MQNNTFPTLFVGQSIQKLAEIDSTNNYLKLMLSNYGPPANGTVIMADHQTAGRGQQGSKWLAPAKKNLTLSFFLKTDFVLAIDQFNLNKAVSLAVYDCLTHFLTEDCKIKWPNDIYVGNKKIAGILIENRVRGKRLKDSIIGIGLNVNQNDFYNVNHATSMFEVMNNEMNREKVLEVLCVALEERYLQLKGCKNFDKEYLINLFRFNIPSLFKCNEDLFEGKIIDVDDTGRLVIESGGTKRSFNIKEVSFVL